jgi:hypothetical protein
VKRRELLGRLAAAAVTPAVAATDHRGSKLAPSTEQATDQKLSWLDTGGRAFLMALAEVVLPSEIGAVGRAEAVEAFARWLRGYDADVEMDHGYGFTRLRRTGPSPASRYPVLIALIDRQAAAAMRKPGASFAAAPLNVRRTVVENSLKSIKAERLLARPGGNVIEDLMAFYFQSSAANDLCYRAAIGRDACRGLPGSEGPPSEF